MKYNKICHSCYSYYKHVKYNHRINLVHRLEGQDVEISLDPCAVSLHIYECLSVFLYETSSGHMLHKCTAV